MTIVDQLDSYRIRFPGCLIVAFADLSTAMVLANSALEKTPQERLDDLCRMAVDCLNPLTVEGDASAISDRTSALRYTVLFDAEKLMCFIRSPLVANEALCIQCTPAVSVRTLIAEGVDLLVKIEREALDA